MTAALRPSASLLGWSSNMTDTVEFGFVSGATFAERPTQYIPLAAAWVEQPQPAAEPQPIPQRLPKVIRRRLGRALAVVAALTLALLILTGCMADTAAPADARPGLGDMGEKYQPGGSDHGLSGFSGRLSGTAKVCRVFCA